MAASVVSSPSGYAPFHVVFDASSSSDHDGSIARYTWNFGDGGTARGVRVKHTFQDDGEYHGILTAEGNRGAEDGATAVIEVLNASPPIARCAYSPQEPVVGQQVVFDASEPYDPASLGPQEVVSWHWDFGDENKGKGQLVEHVYMVPGEYTVTLTITDNDGAEGTTEETVDVGLPAPPPPPALRERGSMVEVGWQPNGYEWHLETDSGETLANGIYLYVVTVMGYDGQTVVTQVKKLAVYR